MEAPLLTAAKLAERLGVSKSSVYRMAAKQLIPSVAWGANLGAVRFNEAEVRAALDQLSKTRRIQHAAREECADRMVNA